MNVGDLVTRIVISRSDLFHCELWVQVQVGTMRHAIKLDYDNIKVQGESIILDIGKVPADRIVNTLTKGEER